MQRAKVAQLEQSSNPIKNETRLQFELQPQGRARQRIWCAFKHRAFRRGSVFHFSGSRGSDIQSCQDGGHDWGYQDHDFEQHPVELLLSHVWVSKVQAQGCWTTWRTSSVSQTGRRQWVSPEGIRGWPEVAPSLALLLVTGSKINRSCYLDLPAPPLDMGTSAPNVYTVHSPPYAESLVRCSMPERKK